MARKINLKNQSENAFLKALSESDLLLRIDKISEQVRLSSINLLQKWVLQEEYLFGLMQSTGTHTPIKTATRQNTVKKQTSNAQKKEATVRKQKDQYYRNTLINRVQQLRDDGTTLQKIAEIFNTEDLPTLSGTGKWFASSVKHLLNTKA